jgi:hypothetical protein
MSWVDFVQFTGQTARGRHVQQSDALLRTRLADAKRHTVEVNDTGHCQFAAIAHQVRACCVLLFSNAQAGIRSNTDTHPSCGVSYGVNAEIHMPGYRTNRLRVSRHTRTIHIPAVIPRLADGCCRGS